MADQNVFLQAIRRSLIAFGIDEDWTDLFEFSANIRKQRMVKKLEGSHDQINEHSKINLDEQKSQLTFDEVYTSTF